MTAAAGCWDVRVIDGRIGVAAGEYRVCVSVAIETGGEDLAGGIELGMSTVRVCIAGFGMAAAAENFLRRRLVHEALDVLMAIDAGKFHRSMDRVLELLAIDKERDLLAVDVFGQRRVPMAGEAILVFDLVLGANGEGRAQQKKCERTEQNPAGNFHAYEETPDGRSTAVIRVTG